MSSTVKFLLSLAFITLINAALAQEITLEQNGAITNGGSNNVGSSFIGSSKTVLFAIQNPGNANLNLTDTPRVTISGPNAADFVVTTQPNSPLEPWGSPMAFTNAGFEYPAYGVGAWVQNPPGAGWTCGYSSGICRNGSPWFVNPAPEGNQAAFIQTNGPGAFVSRTINFPSNGVYAIRFKLVRRGSGFPANDIDVRMDGATLGIIWNTSQPDDVWRVFSASYSCTNAGNHTLAFVGVRGGGDYASCLDDVQILPGGTTFAVTFTPSAEGLRTATLSIPNDSTIILSPWFSREAV